MLKKMLVIAGIGGLAAVIFRKQLVEFVRAAENRLALGYFIKDESPDVLTDEETQPYSEIPLGGR